MANHGKKRSNRPNIVFFDLECTGFDRPIRPVQVGWKENSDKDTQ